ncbi:hypothetical protein V6N13_045894 [Hibiscus sabdariffa]|uniref:Uncharacterized protein n=1 Tax=Hibiscus sabdariffa TaxID=183260 RepID=A0ABR2AXH6_9ROSI
MHFTFYCFMPSFVSLVEMRDRQWAQLLASSVLQGGLIFTLLRFPKGKKKSEVDPVRQLHDHPSQTRQAENDPLMSR